MKERKKRNEVQETHVRNREDEKEIELLLYKGKELLLTIYGFSGIRFPTKNVTWYLMIFSMGNNEEETILEKNN